MKKVVVLTLTLLLTTGIVFKPNNDFEIGEESKLPFEHNLIIIDES